MNDLGVPPIQVKLGIHQNCYVTISNEQISPLAFGLQYQVLLHKPVGREKSLPGGFR